MLGVFDFSNPAVFWAAIALAVSIMGALVGTIIRSRTKRSDRQRAFSGRMANGTMVPTPSQPTVENFQEYRSATEKNYMTLLSIFVEYEDVFKSSTRRKLRSLVKRISEYDRRLEGFRSMQDPPEEAVREAGGNGMNAKIEFINEFMSGAREIISIVR